MILTMLTFKTFNLESIRIIVVHFNGWVMKGYERISANSRNGTRKLSPTSSSLAVEKMEKVILLVIPPAFCFVPKFTNS